MNLEDYPEIAAKIDQIQQGRIMLQDAVNQATDELFGNAEKFGSYWELYTFVRMISKTPEEFNVQMAKARARYLKERSRR